MAVYDKLVDAIGNTPIVKLNRVTEGLGRTVLAKLEMTNIGGAVKSRTALGMIEGAEKSGRVTKDTIFVEASTGNQGIGVAMICAAKGYKCIICIPEHFGIERRKIMQAYGAHVILTPTYDDMEKTIWGCRQVALELEKENPNVIYLRQFDNLDNPAIHARTTAAEILRDVGAQMSAFVGTVGTAGTLSGIARTLKAAVPHVKIIGVEPAAAAFVSEGKKGLHKQEGIGDAVMTRILAKDLIDGWLKVTDDEAFAMARRLAREEGIFCGISSGTAVHAAIEFAKTLEPGAVVVTLLPDTGERYLQTDLWGSDFLPEPERRVPKSVMPF